MTIAVLSSTACGKHGRAALVLAPVLFLSGCATPEPSLVSENRPSAKDRQVLPAPEEKPARPRKDAQAPRAKTPGPIPTRALNVFVECRFRDETGYNGNLRLSVQDARVQAFEAAVNVPGRGVCRFDLKNFHQTRELPNVELNHRRDPCVVRVWEQGERVTVAFQQCTKMCSGTAWDHLWPILNDRRDGSCA